MGLEDNCVVRLQKTKGSVPRVGDGDQLDLTEFSCSGVLIDPQDGLVLTSGQVFAQVVKGRAQRVRTPVARRKWGTSTKHRTDAYFTERDLMKGVHIDVILPRQEPSNRTLLPSASIYRDDSEYRTSDRGTRTQRAKLLLLWKCEGFDDVLKTIVPERDGWQLSEREEAGGGGGRKSGQSGRGSEWGRDSHIGQCVEPFGLSSVSRNLPDENFISWFALLKLTERDDDFQRVHPFNFMRPSAVVDSLLIKRGDPICLQATPFGATCPSVFLNSISKGIVSNVAGAQHQLIMTDARCIPGSEGGGMYLMPADSEPSQQSHLAGIIVSPLCWKNNEWVGLTLVCSIEAVIASLRGVVPLTEQVPPVTALPGPKESYQAPSSVVEHCLRSVVLIKVGAVWGSGVVVNADKGIVVTCRHVVHKATDRHVRVRLDYPYMHWEDATVIYSTNPSSPFDLAILKLGGGVDEMSQASKGPGMRTAESYTEGQPVIIVGHALLAPELDLRPSVSAGVMSKVVHANNIPVMLQSTCAVHSGASGGALFCQRTGSLLGIITSNARDIDLEVSFPHINFSVPWTVIGPVLHDYLQSNDITKLEMLGAHADCLSPIWNLDEQKISQTEQRVLLSKL